MERKMDVDKVNELFQEMVRQGEFHDALGETATLSWWCRKTDKTYHSQCQKAKTYRSSLEVLGDALVDVLTQAHEDKKPWVSEETVRETEERMGAKIYIPRIPV
jgi:hypothetical protein